MNILNSIYSTSLNLLTDLYQLTMAYGYWKSGKQDQEAVFHLFFRKNPFNGQYAVACGLQYVVDFLKNFRFESDDLEYLATLKGNDEKELFEKSFLDYLRDMEFSCDINAFEEGEIVFANEPMLRVRGPIIQCQLLETILLNIINFQTLIATKASRIASVAGDDPILEFGLRRAQGIDGALSASRASYIGGCSATSNVLAGKLFNIPVKGTHAHSWIMSFEDEQESFQAYADAMPNNCVFLVDTYDTIEGVKKAVEVGARLREKGHEMVGIRLDSGDLAELSKIARVILDIGGFPDAKIIASNDLDEYEIEKLKENGAKISIWGVGTSLVTAKDQPALGGVYKLSAIRSKGEDWRYCIKLSEDEDKISNPGILQVRRYFHSGVIFKDILYNEEDNYNAEYSIPHEDMLKPIFKNGEYVGRGYFIKDIREKSIQNRKNGIHATYSLCLDVKLQDLKRKLIKERANECINIG